MYETRQHSCGWIVEDQRARQRDTLGSYSLQLCAKLNRAERVDPRLHQWSVCVHTMSSNPLHKFEHFRQSSRAGNRLRWLGLSRNAHACRSLVGVRRKEATRLAAGNQQLGPICRYDDEAAARS